VKEKQMSKRIINIECLAMIFIIFISSCATSTNNCANTESRSRTPIYAPHHSFDVNDKVQIHTAYWLSVDVKKGDILQNSILSSRQVRIKGLNMYFNIGHVKHLIKIYRKKIIFDDSINKYFGKSFNSENTTNTIVTEDLFD
jgi:hypothetical protein